MSRVGTTPTITFFEKLNFKIHENYHRSIKGITITHR